MFDPPTWAMKDAPVANVEEWGVLVVMAEAADEDGLNAFQSTKTIAVRTRLYEKTVKRRIADMEERGLIVRGDQRYPLLLEIRADRRPVNYTLTIPYSWWGAVRWARMNTWRADRGRPALLPEDRPDLPPAPSLRPRADKGVPGPKVLMAGVTDPAPGTPAWKAMYRERRRAAMGQPAPDPADGGSTRPAADGGSTRPAADGGSSSPARGVYEPRDGGSTRPPTKELKEDLRTDLKTGGRAPRSAPSTPSPASPRGTRLTPDWTPTPADIATVRADAPDVDLDLQLRMFRDHFAAASGQKGVRTDWSATYRNWMRREQRDRRPATNGYRQPADPPPGGGVWDRRVVLPRPDRPAQDVLDLGETGS